MKKVVSDVRFHGYVHHATKAQPQYFIKSDKTDHVAIHKGAALRLLTGLEPLRKAEKLPKGRRKRR